MPLEDRPIPVLWRRKGCPLWPFWARATRTGQLEGRQRDPRLAAPSALLLISPPCGRRSSEVCREVAARGLLGYVVCPGGPVHWRRVPWRRPGTTAGGSGGARAGMAAPLVLVVLAAVTVRAALYRSSLAAFIAERVEVASPLNAWKRGEARRARAGALLTGPSPAGTARRSRGGETLEPGGQGLILAGRRASSGSAVRAPGCAPGRAGPCSAGPDPGLHERALSSRAREEPAGARRPWGREGPAAGGRDQGYSRGAAVRC